MGIGGSEVQVQSPGSIELSARVAAYLTPEQNEAGEIIANIGILNRPFWHLEKSRIGGSRKVSVELVVNGYPVEAREIEADGQIRPVSFEYLLERSSWVALRIYPSVHTNPIYVLVEDKPIRASKRSAQWCRAGVDKCWAMKSSAIRETEIEAAREAYDFARQAYDQIAEVAFDDIPPTTRR